MEDEKEFLPDVIEEKTLIPIPRTMSFAKEELAMGKYDINFAISMLRIIEKKCHDMMMNPRDISFTLRESCKRMIAFLEVEKRNIQR